MDKLLRPQTLLWLALVLALAGSLKHLAAVFASIDNDTVMGWLQAVAIDAGLFALAYSIRVRRSAKRNTRPLWVGVVLFSGISIYGNLAYGLLSTSGALPLWIDVSRPYILAGSLPILVLFLAELLSDDRQYEHKQAEKLAKRLTPKPVEVDNDGESTEQRRRRLVGILSTDGDIGPTQFAKRLNVSRTTVYKDIDTLVHEGIVQRNGAGVKVETQP